MRASNVCLARSRERSENVSGTTGAYSEDLSDVKEFGLSAVRQDTALRCSHRSEGSPFQKSDLDEEIRKGTAELLRFFHH